MAEAKYASSLKYLYQVDQFIIEQDIELICGWKMCGNKYGIKKLVS